MGNSMQNEINHSVNNDVVIVGNGNKVGNISVSSSCSLMSKITEAIKKHKNKYWTDKSVFFGVDLMDKLKVFISLPMDGKTKSEIDECVKKAEDDIRKFIAENGYKGKKDYDIVTFSGYVELAENSNIRNSSLNYMGASLQKLAEADAIWLHDGWESARGCKIEWVCASMYGVHVLNAPAASMRGQDAAATVSLLGDEEEE